MADNRRKTVSLSLVFFFSGLLVYSLMTYGGVRSPDNEAVFRTAESLALRNSFSIPRLLENYPNFGLPKGKDGKYYAWYGPVRSLALMPLIKIWHLLDLKVWFSKPFTPLSHYYRNGFGNFISNTGKKVGSLEGHALRFFVSFFNVIVTALLVTVFFFMIYRLTRSIAAASQVTLLFAFGTMTFHYSGTLYSEPLATLFLLLSFYLLIDLDKVDNSLSRRQSPVLALSGLLLGLSAATHLGAILFAPFFLLYALYNVSKGKSRKDLLRSGAVFSLGVVVTLILLAYFNYARFGNIFETGRTLNTDRVALDTEAFFSPWHGLKGLLWSSGKGLFWYNPAILVSLLFWKSFYKNRKFLANLLLAAIGFWILFNSSRGGWHGGFCLGPRHLYTLIPFLLIPLGFFLKEVLEKKQFKRIELFEGLTIFCACHQIYFNMGEIFSFHQISKLIAFKNGINPFAGNMIYFNWQASPLLHLLNYKRGPFLLQSVKMNNYSLFLLGCLFITLFLFLLYRLLYKYLPELKEMSK